MQDSPRKLTFPKTSRLVKKESFQRVFDEPRKINSKHVVLLYRANEACCARLGIIVTKRLFPRALDRNRIKRIIRESFRHHRQSLPAVDILILLRDKAALVYPQLRDELDGLWAKVA